MAVAQTLCTEQPHPEPGGDEVDSAFATPGMTDNLLGFRHIPIIRMFWMRLPLNPVGI